LDSVFPGAPNQTRCFAHILNLVAKSVLRQFEAPKKKKAMDGKEMDVVEEIEGDGDDNVACDSGAVDGEECDEEVDDDIVDDDEDGLPDELEDLSEDELSGVKASVNPVRDVLTKVSQQTLVISKQSTFLQLRNLSFAIKNSSTIALPKWYEVIEALGLDRRIMPRDVATRWNSTYDMVEFAIEYRAALDTMTADRDMNLRKFELSKKEWAMASELCEVLQVR
jgi:hypothetical protein